jgi:hypothetical protein
MPTSYTVKVTELVVSPLTLAQLDTFLTAGIAAVPGAELMSVTVEISQTTTPAVAPATPPG